MEEDIISIDVITEKFVKIKGELLSYCKRLTKNVHDAEDLLSEVSIKIIKNKDKFNTNTNFNAWCYTICKNTFIDKFRDSKKVQTINYEDFNDVRNVDNTINTSFMKEDLENILMSIPERGRKMILMHYEGFKYDEIAKTLDMPMGTVKSHLNRYKKIVMDNFK